MSIEFRGTGSEWTMLILGVVILLTSLIGLAVPVGNPTQRAKLHESVDALALMGMQQNGADTAALPT
jgi:hypothetical protein